MSKVLCLYHGSDLDGIASGAIVHLVFPEAELWPINYHDVFPWDKIDQDTTVVMCDFCIQPYQDFPKLLASCKKLIWLDHHITAIKALEKQGVIQYSSLVEGYVLGEKYQDANLSFKCVVGTAGCELTWQYFYPDTVMPNFVHLLGRYDVWDFNGNKDEIMAVQYVCRHYLKTPTDDLWLTLLKYSTQEAELDLIGQGRLLYDYQRRQDEKYSNIMCFETTFEGLRAIACNKGMANSTIFDKTYNPERHDIMIAFARNSGRSWNISLYTDKENINVGEIATHYGGGGHKQAAGFVHHFHDLPFEA